MIKKDIIETEIRTSGFKQVQADIIATSGKIDEYNDTLKELKHQRTLLVAAGKKDSDQYKNLNKEIKATNQSLNLEKDALSALYGKLSLGEMSKTQLAKRSKELTKALNETSKAAEPERYAKLEQELGRVNQQMGKMKVGAKQVGSVFQNALSVFAGNMMTKAIEKVKEWAKAAIDWVKEGTAIAGKAEGIQTAFNKLNQKNLLSNLRKETKGTVNDLTLMQTAVKADTFKIPLDGLGRLLKFAQQRAQETGESVDYLTKSIVDGIGKKSPLILDNLGISADRLRQKVKETGDFSAATIAIVNEELEKQGDLALTSADKEERSAVKWENAQLRIGQRFKWVRDIWNDVSGDLADGIARIVGDVRTATERYDEQTESVANLAVNTQPLISRYKELTKEVDENGKKIKLTAEEQDELKKITQQLGAAFPQARGEIGEYGRVLDINIEKVEEMTRVQKELLKTLREEALVDKDKQIRDKQKEIDLINKQIESGYVLNKWFGPQKAKGSDVFDLVNKQAAAYNDLAKLEADRKLLDETTAEQEAQNKEERIRKDEEFRKMTKEQLSAWIENVSDAEKKYVSSAQQIYQQRFGGSGGDSDKDTSKWSLSNDEAHQKALLQLKEKNLAGEFASEKEYKAAILQLEVDTLTKRIDLNKDDAATILSLRGQLSDKLIEQRKTQTEAELRLNKLIEDSQTDLVAKEQQAHQKRLEEYGLAGVKKEQMTKVQLNALEILERQHSAKLDTIENEAIAKSINKSQQDFERQLTLKKTQNNNELAEVNTLEQAKALLRDQYGVEELSGIRTLADARKKIQAEQNKRIEADTAEHLRALMGQLRQAIDSGSFEGLDIGNAILSEEQKKQLEQRLDELGLKLSEILNIKPEDTSGEEQFSFSGGKADILGMSPEDWELFFQHLEDGKIGIQDMIFLVSTLNSVFGMYDSFVTASENKQLKQSQKNNETKKNQLKNRLDHGRMSETAYNEAIEKMDADYEKQKEAIELRQARRKKAQSIIDSLINTAVAVTAALPNIPLSIAVGVLGGIQTALIASQPVAGREKGGFLVEREQDGKMFNAEFAPQKRGKIGKPTILTGENGNEYVIPADGYDNPTLAPIIRTIEDARLRGNLREFDFSNVQPVRLVGQETGGFAGTSGADTSAPEAGYREQTEDHAMWPAIMEVLQKLSIQLDKPIQAIVSILGKQGIKEKMEEYERTRNKGKAA